MTQQGEDKPSPLLWTPFTGCFIAGMAGATACPRPVCHTPHLPIAQIAWYDLHIEQKAYSSVAFRAGNTSVIQEDHIHEYHRITSNDITRI
ncbi:MAG TPA: hypothetical protein VK140_06860 [Ktedonobacteraceae bacterium]|nr:hypothetical protein [Ktedonobacteraceae bacterium]